MSSLSDFWTIIGAEIKKRALDDWKDLSDRGCIPGLASYPWECHTLFTIPTYTYYVYPWECRTIFTIATLHICHNHHNRWLCKKIQSSVKFSYGYVKENALILHKISSFTKHVIYYTTSKCVVETVCNLSHNVV